MGGIQHQWDWDGVVLQLVRYSLVQKRTPALSASSCDCRKPFLLVDPLVGTFCNTM
jgi:hypothetical protein